MAGYDRDSTPAPHQLLDALNSTPFSLSSQDWLFGSWDCSLASMPSLGSFGTAVWQAASVGFIATAAVSDMFAAPEQQKSPPPSPAADASVPRAIGHTEESESLSESLSPAASTDEPAGGEEPPGAASATTIACEQCRASHIKCSGDTPCAQCAARARSCTRRPPRKRGPRASMSSSRAASSSPSPSKSSLLLSLVSALTEDTNQVLQIGCRREVAASPPSDHKRLASAPDFHTDMPPRTRRAVSALECGQLNLLGIAAQMEDSALLQLPHAEMLASQTFDALQPALQEMRIAPLVSLPSTVDWATIPTATMFAFALLMHAAAAQGWNVLASELFTRARTWAGRLMDVAHPHVLCGHLLLGLYCTEVLCDKSRASFYFALAHAGYPAVLPALASASEDSAPVAEPAAAT